MGPGKLIPWSEFEGVLQIPEVLEVLDSPSQTKPSFKSVRHRHIKKTSTRDLEAASETTSQDQDDDDDDDSENDQASLLFSCPGEGCIKAYSRFTSLQAHLGTGKQKGLPEQETLYNKAKRVYASKLMDESSRMTTVQLHCEEQSQFLTPLPMGWTLKTVT